MERTRRASRGRRRALAVIGFVLAASAIVAFVALRADRHGGDTATAPVALTPTQARGCRFLSTAQASAILGTRILQAAPFTDTSARDMETCAWWGHLDGDRGAWGDTAVMLWVTRATSFDDLLATRDLFVYDSQAPHQDLPLTRLGRTAVVVTQHALNPKPWDMALTFVQQGPYVLIVAVQRTPFVADVAAEQTAALEALAHVPRR